MSEEPETKTEELPEILEPKSESKDEEEPETENHKHAVPMLACVKTDATPFRKIDAKTITQSRLKRLKELSEKPEENLSSKQRKEKKRIIRLEKNRRAAAMSRRKKKLYVKNLEERASLMAKHLAILEMENNQLRTMLSHIQKTTNTIDNNNNNNNNNLTTNLITHTQLNISQTNYQTNNDGNNNNENNNENLDILPTKKRLLNDGGISYNNNNNDNSYLYKQYYSIPFLPLTTLPTINDDTINYDINYNNNNLSPPPIINYIGESNDIVEQTTIKDDEFDEDDDIENDDDDVNEMKLGKRKKRE